MPKNKVKTIVLTGGACSGKTTLLDILKDTGTLAGYRLLFIPEAATMLSSHGLNFGDGEVLYQRAILETQLALEDTIRKYAELLDVPCAIICDRGTLDGSAYCGEEAFAALADEKNMTCADLITRYDGVLYLVSAAIGAPQHYTVDNNEARRESLEEAIELGYKTMKCWHAHPYMEVIDNENNKSFPDKMSEAVAALKNMLSMR